MFAAGSMRPEWCFVIQEKENNPLGRVAFWTLPGMEKPLALVLLEVPWEEDHLGAGAPEGETDVLQQLYTLLRTVLELGLHRRGVQDVIDLRGAQPPHLAQRVPEQAGETDRFQWRGEEPPAISDRLFLPHARGGRRGRVRQSYEEGLGRDARPRDP